MFKKYDSHCKLIKSFLAAKKFMATEGLKIQKKQPTPFQLFSIFSTRHPLLPRHAGVA
jgi:hypothetical protein